MKALFNYLINFHILLLFNLGQYSVKLWDHLDPMDVKVTFPTARKGGLRVRVILGWHEGATPKYWKGTQSHPSTSRTHIRRTQLVP